jgi:hypothetical protein
MELEQQPKKVKMSFDDYKKYAFMIINIMKEFENQGEDNVRQQELVDRMVREIEVVSNERHTSIEKGIQTSKMVANIIQYLITNENMLMVS